MAGPVDFDNDNLVLWTYVNDFQPGERRDHTSIIYPSKSFQRRLFDVVSLAVRGEVRRIDYYGDETMTDLVLSEHISYVRNASAFPISQTKIVRYYNADGTEHPVTQSLVKFYNKFSIGEEGKRRRNNVVEQAIIEVFEMLVVTTAANPLAPTVQELVDAEQLGGAFFSTHQDVIQVYKDIGNNPVILDAFTQDNTSWLDNDVTPYGLYAGSIRDYLLYQFDSILAPE